MLTCGLSATANAAEAVVKPLVAKPLPEFPGNEVAVSEVVYPAGYEGPIHRHHAHGFIYVLEGSVVMQVKGGKEVTLTAGQTYYESPTDVHVIGKNASSTQPAKLLSIFVKKQGAPILTLEKASSL
jgi:quercetin dioxygenase-like cupin family protein